MHEFNNIEVNVTYDFDTLTIQTIYGIETMFVENCMLVSRVRLNN
ncbi:hypothetical protein HNP86_000979 [Methanococcus maripaludis]|uniref:Uncharacterized protein n=1 Tax=Methanococcus maripaludis TaxID=39152 RepID=A0A7J9NT54_METMI|nr:hypothetical protein [Methanococcus maripaludis]MBA2850848.1 hypothetical protein [Methanococcus maripaludis]